MIFYLKNRSTNYETKIKIKKFCFDICFLLMIEARLNYLEMTSINMIFYLLSSRKAR
jgi:hypothetical protein